MSLLAAAIFACGISGPIAAPRFVMVAVGVDGYKDQTQGFRATKCSNNAKAFVAAMKQFYGSGKPGDRVEELTSPAETTRAAIYGRMQALAEDTGPDDAFVFFFSGHGTEVPDPSKPTGYSRAIVPSDVRRIGGRTGTIVRDSVIAGPDIRRVLDILAKKGAKNVTLFIDSCNSDNITRGELQPLSGVPNAAMPAKYDPKLKVEGGDLAGALAVISATQENLPAWENTMEGRSVFSMALVDSLRRFSSLLAGHTVSYGTFFDDVRASTRYRASLMEQQQVPQMDGAAGNKERSLFGTETLPQPAYFRTFWEQRGLRVEAGLIHGVSEGFLFGLYPHNADPIGDPAYRVRVAEAGPSASSVEFLGSAPPSGTGWRAVLIDGQPSGKIRVWVEGDAPWKADLANIKVFEQGRESGYDYKVTASGEGFSVVDVAGRQLRALPAKPDRKQLENTFSALAKRKAVEGISPCGPSAIPVQLELVPVVSEGPAGHEVVSDIGAGCRSLDLRTEKNGGEGGRFKNRFALRVRAMHPGGSMRYAPYLTVLDILPNLGIKQLWPIRFDSRGNPYPLSDSKAKFRVPASDKWFYLGRDNSLVAAEPLSPESRKLIAVFEVDGPADGVGFEILKAIATENYEEFEPLFVDGIARAARGDLSPLARLIDSFATSTPVTRSTRSPRAPSAMWSVDSVHLFVDLPGGKAP